MAAPPCCFSDSVPAFPAVDLFTLATRALAITNPYWVRPFVSLILDTIFFSRADSGFLIYKDDLWTGARTGADSTASPTHLFFRERRHKAKSMRELIWRIRAFDFRGFPDLPLLLLHWQQLRDACRAQHGSGRWGHVEFFYGLPSDAHPLSAKSVQA